jgi:hypothetical protein
MAHRHPPIFRAGPLTSVDAQKLNEALTWVYRFLGGLSSSSALNISEDITGANVTLSKSQVTGGMSPTSVTFSGIMAGLSADITAVNNVGFTVNTWTTTGTGNLFDTDSYLNSADTFRLPFVGYYAVTVQLAWQPNAAGGRFCAVVLKVGGSELLANWLPGATSPDLYQNELLTGTFYAATAPLDIQVIASQDSGGNLTLAGGVIFPCPTYCALTYLGS